MRGSIAFLSLLVDEGVTHLFGNPGTTELPLMAALPRFPQLHYVLAAQESAVVTMADGYARAHGGLAACNVHVAPGLGNAMGSLFNAHWIGSPLIVTAGQHEVGHGLTEPMLYAPLEPIARPVVKWAVEVTRLTDLPRVVRRAAKTALAPPTGPVFSLSRATSSRTTRRSTSAGVTASTRNRPADAALDALAERLLAGGQPGARVRARREHAPRARLGSGAGGAARRRGLPGHDTHGRTLRLPP